MGKQWLKCVFKNIYNRWIQCKIMNLEYFSSLGGHRLWHKVTEVPLLYTKTKYPSGLTPASVLTAVGTSLWRLHSLCGSSSWVLLQLVSAHSTRLCLQILEGDGKMQVLQWWCWAWNRRQSMTPAGGKQSLPQMKYLERDHGLLPSYRSTTANAH